MKKVGFVVVKIIIDCELYLVCKNYKSEIIFIF